MSDHFTMLSEPHHATVFEDYEDQRSAKYPDPSVQVLASIRHHHPDMTVTTTLPRWANLLGFAAAGYATAKLDTTEDAILRIRGYIPPQSKEDPGRLADFVSFARYKYTWNNVDFILYTVRVGVTDFEYVLFPPDDDETVLSNSKATDVLMLAVGQAQYPYRDYILVFDFGVWSQNSTLYDQVQKTSWDDVILDEDMKKTLTHTIGEFFDNESKYKDLDVPWKRGLIFYGPPGNGKTLSLRALMHEFSTRQRPITLLYVKSIANVYSISSIFQKARAYSPCLLILEDIDTLVSSGYQSYFFNEVDGLENNDGILMIATTNHLDRLDDGLANRPSRFDRKYNFPNPSYDERVLYSEFWRKKLMSKNTVEFPKELSLEIAKITYDFSFAYMKEAFVAALLAIARSEQTKNMADNDIHDLPLWKEIKKEVKILRDEMGTKNATAATSVTTAGYATLVDRDGLPSRFGLSDPPMSERNSKSTAPPPPPRCIRRIHSQATPPPSSSPPPSSGCGFLAPTPRTIMTAPWSQNDPLWSRPPPPVPPMSPSYPLSSLLPMSDARSLVPLGTTETARNVRRAAFTSSTGFEDIDPEVATIELLLRSPTFNQ